MLYYLIDFCFVDILDYCILLHTPIPDTNDSSYFQIEKYI